MALIHTMAPSTNLWQPSQEQQCVAIVPSASCCYSADCRVSTSRWFQRILTQHIVTPIITDQIVAYIQASRYASRSTNVCQPPFDQHLLVLLALTLPLTRTLQCSSRHDALRIHFPKALYLLRQTRVTPLRSDHIHTVQLLSLELLIKLIHKSFPALAWFTIRQVRQYPFPFLLDIRFDHFAKADGSVTPDLLHGALVEGGNGFLVIPIAGWGVQENALAVRFVEEFDDELGFLIRSGAIREALEATGYKLSARLCE